MADRIALWTLDDEASVPQLFDKVMAVESETLALLRVRLEIDEVLEWLFEFWDAEDQRRIRKKVERLNVVRGDVYIIQLENYECGSGKRRRVEPGFRGDEDVQPPTPEEEYVVLSNPTVNAEADPFGSSRVSGVTGDLDDSVGDGDPLKSTLVSKEIIQQYMVGVEKLRWNLKDSDLDDHK